MKMLTDSQVRTLEDAVTDVNNALQIGSHMADELAGSSIGTELAAIRKRLEAIREKINGALGVAAATCPELQPGEVRHVFIIGRAACLCGQYENRGDVTIERKDRGDLTARSKAVD